MALTTVLVITSGTCLDTLTLLQPSPTAQTEALIEDAASRGPGLGLGLYFILGFMV